MSVACLRILQVALVYVNTLLLQTIDAGSLKRGREPESFGFLQLSTASGGNIGWTGGFAAIAGPESR